MAREHARILSKIWNDPDWKRRSSGAQRLYFQLLSQRAVNHAGVLALTVKKWAGGCETLTVDDIWEALNELADARYVVVDTDTEEVLIRSFIRNDGVAKQPNVLKAALRLATEVESPRLRAALAGELRRLGTAAASRVADELTGKATETLADTLPKGSGNPSGTLESTVDNPVDGNPPGTPGEPFAQIAGVGEGEVVSSCSVVGSVQRGSRERDEPPSPQCLKHLNNPDPPACRACRTARETRERWDAEHVPRQAAAERAAIRACSMCNHDGYLLAPGARSLPASPYTRCDHRPHQHQEPA